MMKTKTKHAIRSAEAPTPMNCRHKAERRPMDLPRVLLAVIARHPQAMEDALRKAS